LATSKFRRRPAENQFEENDLSFVDTRRESPGESRIRECLCRKNRPQLEGRVVFCQNQRRVSSKTQRLQLGYKTAWLSVLGAALVQLAAQGPPASPPVTPRIRPSAFPARPPADPASIDRGKALYGVNCNFCHGSDARGGEGGPNLLRSELVLNDKNGELIAPVVQNGRPDQGMPKFPLTLAQVSDIAAYIHDFKVGGYDLSRMKPPSIIVGDAEAGRVYFQATCATCHSVTGDLRGIGSRISDPKLLQDTFIMPGGGGGFRPPSAAGVNVPPTMVSVAFPNGERFQGRLVRIDDFIVVLIQEDGEERSFRRDGEAPRVEIQDPLQPHKELLSRYSDRDIHNLTAYLVTIK
jgi:cytochrome c oxidase cbb3-type subunit III